MAEMHSQSYHINNKNNGWDVQPCHIKTHGRVSVAKKDVWHTSVLFIGIILLSHHFQHLVSL